VTLHHMPGSSRGGGSGDGAMFRKPAAATNTVPQHRSAGRGAHDIAPAAAMCEDGAGESTGHKHRMSVKRLFSKNRGTAMILELTLPSAI